MANTKFLAAVKKAKALYKTGKFKKFSDAVKAAWKGSAAPAKKKKKVGSTLLLEKGETRRTKPKRVITITRTKKGTFKKVGSVNNNLPNYSDPDAAREIELYWDNSNEVYFKKREPIQRNLYKKWKKGNYNTQLAAKLFKLGIDFTLQVYNKEFGSSGSSWSRVLSVADRKLLALNLAIEFKNSLDSGAQDYVYN